MKYYKLIGCKILEREISSLTFNCKNVIDITLIRQKFHDRPEKIREVVQNEIDQVDQNRHRYSNDTQINDFDAILLGYGLCSNAVIGLCSEKYPLVIPRAHDCITLFMGSKEAYAQYYKEHKGTFYYTPGFVELGGMSEEDKWRRRYQMYLARYKGNEEKARCVIEIEKSFTDNYQGLSYIKWNSLEFPEYEEELKQRAEKKGWKYEEIPGNNTLLKKMVDGEWEERDFLIVPPHHRVEPSYDEEIIKIQKI